LLGWIVPGEYVILHDYYITMFPITEVMEKLNDGPHADHEKEQKNESDL